MKNQTVEVIVGVFVVIGILCIGYLTIKLGKLEMFGDDHYSLSASFNSVSGLKVGATIEMAGVPIGKVDSISLDAKRLVAVVSLKIENQYQLSDDVIAAIKTSGLIGDKYIKLYPGGSDIMLESGDVITETESTVDVEELISKYVFGGV